MKKIIFIYRNIWQKKVYFIMKGIKNNKLD